uniref:Uncharacterized protein n=1 Tax=mine drainage metagenome TaxID=410659 RepID=E6QNQ5_9ZZZZ
MRWRKWITCIPFLRKIPESGIELTSAEQVIDITWRPTPIKNYSRMA